MISYAPFIPHTLAQLTEARVFPSALPEAFYAKLLAEYAAMDDVVTSRITYDSDGLRVTGLAALPAAIEKGAHPILIYNRGGSREYGKLTLLSVMRSMAPFAREKMLVFASNYRGNDGGEGREEFGGRDVHDVLNLLTLAKLHPGWDGKNIFMLGHSRGGMMSYLALQAGAPVNAAVSLAGLADLWRAAKEHPDMEALYQRLIPTLAEDREQQLRARSAVYWADELTTPLLLLHGEADEVVPPSHSVRLAEALAAAGRPHALHLYPEGNHALVRVWDEVLAHCLRWFAEHRA